MLRASLFAALLIATVSTPLRLPDSISIEPRLIDYGDRDSVPAEIVKGWIMDEIQRRDPDLATQKDMITTFFDESVGIGMLARNSITEKVDFFLRRDFYKKVDAMQEYLIRLYSKQLLI